MSELTAEISDQVLAACQANASDISATLSSALGVELTVSVGDPEKFAADLIPSGPGLAVLLSFGEVGFAAVLAEASELIPSWYVSPDVTGLSKLSTLAQEFSLQLLPDALAAEKFQAARVGDLRGAVGRAGVAEAAALLPLQLNAGDKTAQLHLVWPLSSPSGLFDPAQARETSAPVPTTKPAPQRAKNLTELPGYTRSLLKISVPVRVVLAEKRENVQDVVEMAPGTIIKFSKSCDEVLQLFVGDQSVAKGEAVKVGDKFGFRITEMTLPEEHFLQVRPNRAS